MTSTHFEGKHKLINVKEAASYLGIGLQTLYQSRPDVPRIKIGGRILFDVNDLDAYIEANRVKESK